MDSDPNFQEITVLIIDDNPTNLGVIADYLDAYGFEILTATDGPDGVATAQQAQPDIILLDVMMPGIDGFETCRRLKADPATQDIAIIFMTALASTEDKVTGFKAGAVDYVTKPIQQEEVLARVTTHLKIQNLTRQLKTANTELYQANTELARLSANKDKFLSIVAHDLKGPFQPILGLTDFMSEMVESLPPAEIKEMLESVHRSARSIYDLLENLLTWSRLQMDRIEHQPVAIRLSEVVASNLKLLAEVAATKRITLHPALPETLMVEADQNALTTVIRNLTSNALKFTPAGGSITISARPVAAEDSNGNNKLPDMVEVWVADTGVGISPANMQKLFRIDVQHTTAGTANERGTGLGLLICQEMVEKNGGHIWVESELGVGTTIKFTVPQAVLA